MTNTRRRTFQRPIVSAIAVGLTVAVIAAWIQSSSNRQRVAANFEATLDRMMVEIRSRLQRYEFGVRGARGVVIGAGGEPIDRDRFARYMASRDLEREFPGARGFGFIRRVAAADVPAFEARARAEGRPAFGIRQLAPNDGERWVAQYVEPESRNDQVLGLDIASDPVRRRAAEQAMDSGEARLTAPVTLLQMPELSRRGLLLLLPIYRPGLPAATPAERRAATIGWSYAPLVIDEVLAGLSAPGGTVALQLVDAGPDGSPEPFFSTLTADDRPLAEWHSTHRLDVFGRVWEIRGLGLAPLLPASGAVPPAATAAIAGAASSLLAALVLLLVAARQRRREERELQDVLARGVVDAISNAILVVDERGRIVAANPGASRVFGYPRAGLLGRSVDDLVPAARRAGHARLRQGYGRIASAKGARPELWALHADGHEFPVEIHLGPLDLGGRKMVVAGVVDISRARADRLQLEQSERRWRQMANSQPQLVWTCVADGSCDFLSQRWVEYTGIAEAEQLGSGWLRQVHPDDQARLQQAWQAAVDSLSTFHVEFRIRRHDGVYRWFDTQAVPLLDERGQLVQWIGSNTDIDQRKQAEESLRALNVTLEARVLERTAQLERARADLRRILDAVPLMIGYWDRELCNRFANQAYADWFGVDPAAVLGQTMQTLFSAEIFEANRSHIDAALAGTPQTFERSAGGRYWIVRYLPDEVGGEVVGFYNVVTDVTELRAAMKAAEAASAAKSSFLANMSHEIRTPMNAVMNLCYLLEAGTLDADQRDLVGKMRIASRSLLGLINDVLDLSKIEAGHMGLSAETFALHALLHDAVQLMLPQARGKGVALWLDIGPEVPEYVRGDRLRINQVLGNLIGNAVKFTERGSIQVRVRYEGRSDESCTLLFEVVDTGIGIAAEVQAQLFEPFVQADDSATRRFSGSGLGLAIVKRLVTLMDGTLGVDSVPGRGSCFWFRLNLRRETEATLSGAAPKSFDVLIADDSDSEREALAASARALGWRAEAVSSGRELIDRVEDRRSAGGRFDALLLDWRMPGLDGLETLTELHQRFGGAPAPAVILVTVFDRHELAALPQSGLADIVLSKPVDAAALFNAVHAAAGVHRMPPLPGSMGGGQPLRGLRILLVDDSPINLEVGERVLARAGAAVVRAAHGEEALAVLRAGPEAIDLVLMDVQMPVLDGNAATRRIRGELGLGRLPVVALTAGALLSERQRALESGMDAFISKPFDPREMVSLICRLVGRQPGAGPQAASDPEAPVIAGLAIAEVGRRLDGDWALLRTLLRRLFEEFGSGWPEAPDGLDDAQRGALAQRAHKLRGVAGNLGAAGLREQATRLEAAARAAAPSAPALAPLLAAIVVELDRLRAASADFLAGAAGSPDIAEAPVVDPAELQALRALLREQRLDAVSRHEQLRADLRAALGPDRAGRLEQAIQDLRFAEALEMLAGLAPGTTAGAAPAAPG